MPRLFRLCLVTLLACLAQPLATHGGESSSNDWASALYLETQDSAVVVQQVSDHGEVLGSGSGFVIGGGVIVTCFHVIGEGHALTVTWKNGEKSLVREIVAWDEVHDLAVIRPELPPSVKGWKALPLAGDETPEAGAAGLALGSPNGWRSSVATGLMIGEREVEGRKLLQLSMPIDQGNSGGPVLDVDGRVRGIVTMRSATKANVGFAVPIRQLHSLLGKKNPVTMERWQGLSLLDSALWRPDASGDWKSASGAVRIGCEGEPATGRTLCLRQSGKTTPWAGNLQTWVRGDAGTGGAGIAFGHRENGGHLGLFASEGELWLVDFPDADPAHWSIIEHAAIPDWKKQQWNEISVSWSGQECCGSFKGREVLKARVGRPLQGAGFGLLKLGRMHADFRGLQLREPEDSQPSSAQEVLAQAESMDERAAKLRQQVKEQQEEQAAQALSFLLSAEKFDPAAAAFLMAAILDPGAPIQAFTTTWSETLNAAAEFPRQSTMMDRLTLVRSLIVDRLGLRVVAPQAMEAEHFLAHRALDSRCASASLMRCFWLSLAGAAKLPLVPLADANYLGLEPQDGEQSWLLLDLRTARLLSAEESAPLLGQRLRNDTARRGERISLVEVVAQMLRVANMERLERGEICTPLLDAIVAWHPDAAHERLLRAVLRKRSGDQQGWATDWAILCADDPKLPDHPMVRSLDAGGSPALAPPAWQKGLPQRSLRSTSQAFSTDLPHPISRLTEPNSITPHRNE